MDTQTQYIAIVTLSDGPRARLTLKGKNLQSIRKQIAIAKENLPWMFVYIYEAKLIEVDGL